MSESPSVGQFNQGVKTETPFRQIHCLHRKSSRPPPPKREPNLLCFVLLPSGSVKFGTRWSRGPFNQISCPYVAISHFQPPYLLLGSQTLNVAKLKLNCSQSATPGPCY